MAQNEREAVIQAYGADEKVNLWGREPSEEGADASLTILCVWRKERKKDAYIFGLAFFAVAEPGNRENICVAPSYTF